MNRPLLIAVLLAGLSASGQPAGQGQPSDAEAADAGYAGPDVSKLPLNERSIRLVMDFHQPKVQACYEEFLAGRKKPVEGRLTTSFVITAEGLVKKPKVLKKGTTLRDARLHDCVVAALASLEFPRPTDGREQPIEYPFNLKAIK